MDLSQLMKEMPALAILAFFTWAMLKIVQQVVTNYQNVLNGIMQDILKVLKEIDTRTLACGKTEDN